jgi:hypothetical protein
MLVNTIIKESAGGINLKAEIRTTSEHNDYIVKYYINGELNGITRYPFQSVETVQENIDSWMKGIMPLNG